MYFSYAITDWCRSFFLVQHPNRTFLYEISHNLSQSTPAGGLFDKIINKTEEEKKPEEKKGGLFSGLFANQPTTAGLFTTNQTGSGGLFGSIFGNSGAGLGSLAKKGG